MRNHEELTGARKWDPITALDLVNAKETEGEKLTLVWIRCNQARHFLTRDSAAVRSPTRHQVSLKSQHYELCPLRLSSTYDLTHA